MDQIWAVNSNQHWLLKSTQITQVYFDYVFPHQLLKSTPIMQIYITWFTSTSTNNTVTKKPTTAYMTDDGQETVACLYRKICNLCKGMRFGCAAAYIICLALQHFALHMATWPDAVHNVSLCRQLRFPFLLEVFEEAVTGFIGHFHLQGSKVWRYGQIYSLLLWRCLLLPGACWRGACGGSCESDSRSESLGPPL